MHNQIVDRILFVINHGKILRFIYKELKNVYLFGAYMWSGAIQNIVIKSLSYLIHNYLAYIYGLFKKYILNYIKDFLFTIVYCFYFNSKNYGLNIASIILIFDMHIIFVPKTRWINIAVVYTSYNFLPLEWLVNPSCLSDYFSIVLLVYILIIWILDISVWLNQKLILEYFSHDYNRVNEKRVLILNLTILVILSLLICVLSLLVYLMINMLHGQLLEYIVKMMRGITQSFLPGGFGQPVGGGGMPPKKPGGPEPPKGHYTEDSNKRKREIEACEDNWDIINKVHAEWAERESRYLDTLNEEDRHRALREWHLRIMENYQRLNNWQEFGDLDPYAFRKEVDRLYSRGLVDSSYPITKGYASYHQVSEYKAINPPRPGESTREYSSRCERGINSSYKKRKRQKRDEKK